MGAWVTGGTGGLGAAICRALAAEGLPVAIGYLRRHDAAGALAHELEAMGSRAIVVQADVADAVQTAAAAGRIAGEFGELRVLVNAAVHNVDGLLANLPAEGIARMYEVNVIGALNAIRAALPHLVASGKGRIVNFSSVLAHRPIPGVSAYAGTKGAMESLTRSLAVELGPKQVTVNAVAPGFVDAGLGRKPVREAGDALSVLVPLRRAGTAEDVAAVVAFLASAAARYVTGAVIPVDGGLLAGAQKLNLRPRTSEGAPIP